MTRQTLHLLICLVLSVTLAGAGAVGAAVRLSMAIETNSMTQVVLCAEDGAQVVLLDATGMPVPQGTVGQCARCLECCQAFAATLTCLAAPVEISQRLLVPELSVPDPDATPTRAVWPHQARAPPKEA